MKKEANLFLAVGAAAVVTGGVIALALMDKTAATVAKQLVPTPEGVPQTVVTPSGFMVQSGAEDQLYEIAVATFGTVAPRASDVESFIAAQSVVGIGGQALPSVNGTWIVHLDVPANSAPVELQDSQGTFPSGATLDFGIVGVSLVASGGVALNPPQPVQHVG